MKVKQLFLSGCAAMLVTAHAASAATYTEAGDAGHTFATAQGLGGGTTVIQGSLGPAGSGDVDMYKFAWGGGAFAANTFGSSHGDLMLWLFDAAGRGVQGDDDTGANAADLDALLEIASLQAGIYYLAISPFAVTPQSHGQLMFVDLSQAGPVDPNWVLEGWSGPGTDAGPAPGTPEYVINIPDTAALPGGDTPVPEPATLALLGAGLVGLGLTRRKRHS